HDLDARSTAMRDKRLVKLLHRTRHLGTGGSGEALGEQGVRVSERAASTGDLATLDEAIDLLERALDATRQRHPNQVLWLSNLGFDLTRRFERTGTLGDLDRAVEVDEQAVEITPEDHPDRPTYLSNLGVALAHRFERTGTLGDLDR